MSAPGIVLTGDRLQLREFTVADEAAVRAYASDPEVTRFMVWGPNTAAETRAHLRDVAGQAGTPDRRDYDLAVVEHASREVVGGAALRVTSGPHRRGDIGYVLHRRVWSRGYGTEAARMLLRFGFGQLRLHRIIATCHPDNHASARVLTKAGMTYEGRLRSHLLVDGGWCDSLLFAAIGDDGSDAAAAPRSAAGSQ